MTTKQLKIIGEIILIISFLIQTLLFDFYNDKSQALLNSGLAQAMVDKGSELKELKYFVAKFPTDSLTEQEYQALNINLAAQKLAIAKTIQITSLDTTKEARTNMSNVLIEKSKTVHNFSDYMNFITTINNQYVGDKVILRQIEKINCNKDFYRKLFIALYIIGAGLLVASIFKEKEKK